MLYHSWLQNSVKDLCRQLEEKQGALADVSVKDLRQRLEGRMRTEETFKYPSLRVEMIAISQVFLEIFVLDLSNKFLK